MTRSTFEEEEQDGPNNGYFSHKLRSGTRGQIASVHAFHDLLIAANYECVAFLLCLHAVRAVRAGAHLSHKVHDAPEAGTDGLTPENLA